MDHRQLFIFGFAIFVIGIMAESITSWIAIRTVRRRYPELWKHSGSPTILGNSDLTKAWRLMKYYYKRAYRRQIAHGPNTMPPIADQNILNFAEKLRGPLVYTYLAACVSAIFFAALIIFGGASFR
jgi:hypothetical protein